MVPRRARRLRWRDALPVVIVSAATPPFPDPDQQAAWPESHAKLAETPGTTRVVAAHSDHDITETEYEVVIAFVQRVLGRR